MPTPKDKELYEKIKKEIYLKYPQHSAYRSALLSREYKKEFEKKHKNKNSYSGNRETSNLGRWFKEEWKNQRGEVGYKKKGDVYRPTKKINSKTPTTFNELNKSQIKKAMKEKKETGKANLLKI